jgi:hypothetical protein
MKRYIVSGLLIVMATVSTMADVISLNSGRMMVGKVGVGPNIGGVCALMVNSSQVDLFSPRYDVTFSLMKVVEKKWVTARAERFSIQSYSDGDWFGAKSYTDKTGVQKKVTAVLSFDLKTQMYTVRLHDAKLVSDGTVGKFIVCEKMVLR